MSKQALYDAFMAGFKAGEQMADRAFNRPEDSFAVWFNHAVATGDRNPPTRAYDEIEDADRDSVAAIERKVIGSNHVDWDRQRDIDTEGQRAAVYYANKDKGSDKR